MSTHPALKFPLDARVDYAMLVASILVIDGALNPVEVEDLEVLCEQLDLPPNEEARVLAYAKHPDVGHTANLFHHIIGSELRFALIIDLIVAAMADGKYAEAEASRVHSLASRLGIDPARAHAIERKVLASGKRRVGKREISEIAHDPDPLAGSLLGALVPTALAIVTPIIELTALSPGIMLGLLGVGDDATPHGPSAVLTAITRLGLGGGPVAGVVVAFVSSLLAYAASRAILVRGFPHAR